MSGAEQEVPAPDEDVPAEPQPQREQRPPAERVAHDHPERVAERGHPADMAERQALPREQRPEQHHPDEITNYRMLGHIDLLGWWRAGQSAWDPGGPGPGWPGPAWPRSRYRGPPTVYHCPGPSECS